MARNKKTGTRTKVSAPTEPAVSAAEALSLPPAEPDVPAEVSADEPELALVAEPAPVAAVPAQPPARPKAKKKLKIENKAIAAEDEATEKKGKKKEKGKDKKKKKKEKKEAVLIRFDQAQLDRIDDHAAAIGLSRAGWVRMVVAQALDR